jgi:hypothetical protein
MTVKSLEQDPEGVRSTKIPAVVVGTAQLRFSVPSGFL